MQATASDANAKTATCQKSLVDAVHSTSTELKDCPDPTDPSAGGCGEYAAVSNGETHGHGMSWCVVSVHPSALVVWCLRTLVLES